MIWVGTSGWAYGHWVGRFYPPDLPPRAWLAFYARNFATVEINRSFYRLPTREQFTAWADQVAPWPEFCFAVKASRYLTHLKKLRDPAEGLARLLDASSGLGTRRGPFLYQLPPHWQADPARLAGFVAQRPAGTRSAFEFRDSTWFRTDVLGVLAEAGCALVVAVGGACPTALDLPPVGPFRYVRVHGGAHGVGLSDEEVAQLAKSLAAGPAADRDAYVYFNNDPDGHAVVDARRLRDALDRLGAPVR
ncbi:MAG TPA: DUF72 domain-containing protein [Thermomicrobiaceae bacterium]|nr:DUF72 domain-containing protein [Thermomicrobiaceae bacterium]